MDDYKRHFKTSHKIHRKKILSTNEGEVDVSELLGQANNFYINNQYDDAIRVFHEVITHSPDLREPYQILSIIFEERGDLQKALSFLMLAAQLSHGEKEIWVRCANLNKKLNNLQQADYCLARAIKIDKNNQYFLYERASIQEELGNLKKAATIYEKLFKFSPNAEILLLHISHLYEKLNIIEKSITVIENNLEKISRKLKILIRLFDLYLKYEKYSQGYLMYEKLQNLNEFNSYIINSHIRIRFLFCSLELSELKNNQILLNLSDKIEEIILQEYLEEEKIEIPENLPNNSEIIDEIIQEFGKVSSEVEMENNLDLLYKLFDILQNANNIDKFIFMYEKLENNFSNNSQNPFSLNEEISYQFVLTPEIYSKIGEHYLRVKNYYKAIDFFIKCLKNSNKKSSDDVLIRFKLSEIYKIVGDFHSALEVLNKDTNDFLSIKNNINKEEEFTENNPFEMEENINRDFLQNQIENSQGEDNNEDEENNNLNNPLTLIKDLSYKSFKETRRNSLNFSEYNNIMGNLNLTNYNKKKFLGNKRIRLKTNNAANNNSIENYNFETYLRRKNSVKSTDSNLTGSFLKNLNSLKLEYDELNEEINNCHDLYIKLQESLIYFQQEDIPKFLDNTFNPLKQILIYELKIEDFKSQLFNNILEKSTIKNYFKINESVFDENTNSYNLLNNGDEFHDYEEDKPNKNESLFIRKTERHNLLERKKVRKTMELVEKQMNNLQNVDKFISEENFMKIIVSFVQFAYSNKKYEESIQILQLILNSNNFKQRNDYILFNMNIYSILNNIQLGNHRIAFVLMKRLIVTYDLKDFPIFWIYLRNVSNSLNLSHLRNFYYKLTYSEEMCKNIYLNSLLANCYLQSGNYDLSMRHLELLDETKFYNDPFFYFQKGLIKLFKSMSRRVLKKEKFLLKANEFFNIYAMKRNRTNPTEVLFNMGRFYQFIGHDSLAKENYNQILSRLDYDKNCDDDKLKKTKETIYMSTVYNYSLILKKNGNEKEAHQMIMDNIIIE